MFRRITRLWTGPRRIIDQLAALDAQAIRIESTLGQINDRLTSLAAEELPGLVALSERRLRASADERIDGVSAQVESQRRALLLELEHLKERLQVATVDLGAAIADAHQSSIAVSREHAEAASSAAATSAIEVTREHAEALGQESANALRRDIAEIRRELRAAQRQAPTVAGSEIVVKDSRLVDIDPVLYATIEDHFRGDPSLVEERQREYLPFVCDIADDDHPVVDLGCGRGEWLRLLIDAGVPAIGVDTNPAFVADCTEADLNVVHQDLVSYLESSADGSAGAITMFQVAEHLPPAVLIDVLNHCARVLRAGGILIAETPNSLNLRVGATTFWLDPTHQRPLHPELMKLLATHAGFSKVDARFANPLGTPREGIADDSTGAEVRRLAEMVDGPGDFCLLAWR